MNEGNTDSAKDTFLARFTLLRDRRKSDGVLFFTQWFADAWESTGGKVRYTIRLPYFLRRIISKLDLAIVPAWVSQVFDKKSILLICGGWKLESCIWPYFYKNEIIPVLWDCWPCCWTSLIKNLRRLKPKVVFFTSSQVAEYVRNELPSIKTVWMPEGIDVSLYPSGVSLTERKYDVLGFGRRLPKVENALVAASHAKLLKYKCGGMAAFNDLVSALQNAKITLCWPRCDTNPEQAGNIETLTQRYWECMLSRTIMMGRAPKELVDICGYNPVLPLGDNPVDDVKVVLNNLEKYQFFVDKNRMSAMDKAPWVNRIPIIKDALKEVYGID